MPKPPLPFQHVRLLCVTFLKSLSQCQYPSHPHIICNYIYFICNLLYYMFSHIIVVEMEGVEPSSIWAANKSTSGQFIVCLIFTNSAHFSYSSVSVKYSISWSSVAIFRGFLNNQVPSGNSDRSISLTRYSYVLFFSVWFKLLKKRMNFVVEFRLMEIF